MEEVLMACEGELKYFRIDLENNSNDFIWFQLILSHLLLILMTLIVLNIL